MKTYTYNTYTFEAVPTGIAGAFLALRKVFTADVGNVQLVPCARAPAVPDVNPGRHSGKRVLVDLQQLGVGQNALDLGRHVAHIHRREQRRCRHHPHRHVSNRLLAAEAGAPLGACPDVESKMKLTET